MHRPAPVSYPTGPGPVALGLQAGAGMLGMACSLAALGLQSAASWRTAVLLIVGVVCICGMASAWRSRHSHRNLPLTFDGQAWMFGSHAQARPPFVCLDLPGALLIRLTPRRRWVWLERSIAPGHWHALRQAMFCGDAPHDPTGAATEKGLA